MAQEKYEQLALYKTPLLRLAQMCSSGFDRSSEDGLPHLPVGTDVNLRKSLLALSYLYGTECKTAFEELGLSIQRSTVIREELMQYYRRQGASTATSFATQLEYV